MATSVLVELDDDVQQLLWAGSGAAAGNLALTQHAAALKALGAHVPALAKVAELAEGALTAGDAKPLLKLAAAACQVSAAQLQAAPADGELTPFTERSDAAEFRSAPSKVLYAMIDALAAKKKPPEALAQAFEDPQVARDPRLWRALLAAFAEKQVRDRAASLAARAGLGLLPSLETAFDPKGKAEDAARLRAIGGIRGAAGEELYRACLKKGSPLVRIAALECLSTLGPERFSEVLLPYFDSLKSDSARYDCFRALCLLDTRPAVERVLAVCLETSRAADGLLQTLAAAQHSLFLDVAREQALKLAQPGEQHFLLDFRRLPPGGDYAVALLAAADPTVRRHAATRVLSSAVSLDAARAGSRDRAIDVLIAVADDDGGNRIEALTNLLTSGEPKALERVAAELRQPQLRVPALFALGEARAYEALHGDVRLYVDARNGRAEADVGLLYDLVMAALRRLSPKSDRRWEPLLLDLVELGDVHGSAEYTDRFGARDAAIARLMKVAFSDHPKAGYAVNALGIMRAREAVPGLCAALDRCPTAKTDLNVLLRALGEIGDPAAIPALERVKARPDATDFLRQYATTMIAEASRGRA